MNGRLKATNSLYSFKFYQKHFSNLEYLIRLLKLS